MKIINKTKNAVISDQAEAATSFFNRTFGLINPRKPRTLVFNTHFGIHTFGMHEQIDILVLDNQNKVVSLKRSLKPQRIFTWQLQYNRVIELPAGSITRSQTELGDVIQYEL